MSAKTSLNEEEIQHFQKDSAHWWDEKGPFAPLHKLNPVRMTYVRDQITEHLCLNNVNDDKKASPLNGLNIADIGCGGGLVSESLSRMGANVTGIDADSTAIDVAKEHAKQSGLSINYLSATAEDLTTKYAEKFDVICALEIIEHVESPEFFIETVLKLLKPEGLLILSTLNRTIKSVLLGIYAAEYVLNWVPKGTHTHSKFLKPSEVCSILRENNATYKDITGMTYSFSKNDFALNKNDVSVNYFISALKNSAKR